MLVACDSGGDDDGADAAGTDGGSGGSDDATAGDGGDDSADSSGGVDPGPVELEAMGSLNGIAFSLSCGFGDPDRGSKTCVDGAAELICLEPGRGSGAVDGTLAVTVRLMATQQLGMTNFTVPGTGVQVGDIDGVGLDPASPNTELVQITLDAFEPGTSATGSFTATWTNDGTGLFGNVDGTFDFTCP